MVLGGSLFSRHSRVRFSGRTEREVCRQPVRREQPQFSRWAPGGSTGRTGADSAQIRNSRDADLQI